MGLGNSFPKKRTWGGPGGQVDHENMPLQTRTAYWAAFWQSITSRSREVILLCSALVRYTWSAGFPSTRQTGVHWGIWRKTIIIAKGLENVNRDIGGAEAELSGEKTYFFVL